MIFSLNRYRLLSAIVFGFVLFIIVVLMSVGHIKHNQKKIIVYVDPPLNQNETNQYVLLKNPKRKDNSNSQRRISLKQKTKRYNVQVSALGRILNPSTQTTHAYCFDSVC